MPKPKEPKIKGKEAQAIHDPQLAGAVVVTVDVCHMSTPAIKLWVAKNKPAANDPPKHTFRYCDVATSRWAGDLGLLEKVWAAVTGDSSRPHVMRVHE